MFNRRIITIVGWALPTWMLLCGCNGNPPQYTSGEGAAVQEAISNFSEAVKSGNGEHPLFVEGAFPDAEALTRFQSFAPSAGRVTISGDTATAEVEFEELATGVITGPAEWTLERVDGVWKIKTCPAP